MHIFFGKFVGGQFLYLKSIRNFGDEPRVYDIATLQSGFVLIGTFTSTVVCEGQDEEYLKMERKIPISRCLYQAAQMPNPSAFVIL